MNGFRAAVDGEPRDPRQSAEWLDAYDGTTSALQQKAAEEAEIQAWRNTPSAISHARRHKAKMRRNNPNRLGCAPRSL